MRISDWSSDVCSSDLSGCKVLSSRVGLTPDLLPDACLFDDALDAARRIAADAAEGCLAKSSAAATRAAAERHTPASVRKQLLKAYAELPAVPERRRLRSAERRVGKECVSKGRSWWSACPEKKKGKKDRTKRST